MTRRETLAAVLDGQASERPPVSVRLALWHADAAASNTLPPEIRGLSARQVEDRLGFGQTSRHRAHPRIRFGAIELGASRDGHHWDRRFMEAFLRPGPDLDNWTERNMYIGPNVVPTGPDEMSLYYLEHYRHPTCRFRRASLRMDGFVSVHAGYAGGELVTKQLTFEGQELTINYATSAVGSLRVEVQDEKGNAMAGYGLEEAPEIYGDQIERVVAWQNGTDVSAFAGRPIRLRFAMKDADLYAIRFRP